MFRRKKTEEQLAPTVPAHPDLRGFKEAARSGISPLRERRSSTVVEVEAQSSFIGVHNNNKRETSNGKGEKL